MGGVGSVEILTTAAPDHPGTDRSVLSSDADTVYQQLMASIAAHDDTATPGSTQILDEIIGLHTTFVLTPSERAATIAVLAMVDDLSVTTDGATVTVTSEYATEAGREVLTALFDGSGWLVGESLVLLDGVPGLTSERVQAYRATYAAPDVIP